MVAVQATEDEVRPLLAGRVGIAAINSADSVVVSGDEDLVLRIAAGFAERDAGSSGSGSVTRSTRR